MEKQEGVDKPAADPKPRKEWTGAPKTRKGLEKADRTEETCKRKFILTEQKKPETVESAGKESAGKRTSASEAAKCIRPSAFGQVPGSQVHLELLHFGRAGELHFFTRPSLHFFTGVG